MADVQLPTIAVTQVQATRILAAFQAKYGTTTTAETVAAYKKELTEFVRRSVLTFENDRLAADQTAYIQAQLSAIGGALPTVPGGEPL